MNMILAVIMKYEITDGTYTICICSGSVLSTSIYNPNMHVI